MDAIEALKLLKDGKRVKKESWNDSSFIKRRGDDILDQDGYCCNLSSGFFNSEWVEVSNYPTGLYKDNDGDYSIFDGKKWYYWGDSGWLSLSDTYTESGPQLIEEYPASISDKLEFTTKVIRDGE